MDAMNPLLSRARILSQLQPEAGALAIEVVAETGSTNADLLARLDGFAGPVLLAAESQTAGRGRAGRTWHSDPAASLTFSLAWPFQRPLPALLGLPLAVGTALAETLAAQGTAVQLKWPNDLLLHGEKLGGILVETAARKGGGVMTWAVIGIGLNLLMPPALAQKIGNAAAALPCGLSADRNRLLAALANGLAAALPQFERAGFAAFAARWNALHAHAGRLVKIVDRERTLHEGVAIGVDEHGRLLLDTDRGQVAVMAGDVSLRIQEGQHAVAG